jgi:hypothetical protein
MPIDPSPHRHEQPDRVARSGRAARGDRVLRIDVRPDRPADPSPPPPAETIVTDNDRFVYAHRRPTGPNRLSVMTAKPTLLVAPRGGFGWMPEMEPDPDLRPDVDGAPPTVAATHGPVPDDWVPGFDPDPDPVALRLVGRRVPERPPVPAPASPRRAFGGNVLAAAIAWGVLLLVAEVIVVAALVATLGGG